MRQQTHQWAAHTRQDDGVSHPAVLSEPTLQGQPQKAPMPLLPSSWPQPTWRRVACSCLRFMSLMYQATAVMDTMASSTISRPPPPGPSAQCLPSSYGEATGHPGEEKKQENDDNDKKQKYKGRSGNGDPEKERDKQTGTQSGISCCQSPLPARPYLECWPNF